MWFCPVAIVIGHPRIETTVGKQSDRSALGLRLPGKGHGPSDEEHWNKRRAGRKGIKMLCLLIASVGPVKDIVVCASPWQSMAIALG